MRWAKGLMWLTGALGLLGAVCPTARGGPEPEAATALPEAFKPLAAVIAAEQTRAMALGDPGQGQPYFSSVNYVKVSSYGVHATLGALLAEEPQNAVVAKIALRLGDHGLDNSNFAGSPDNGFFEVGPTLFRAPVDESLFALRRTLWAEFDRRYREASDILQQKRTARASAVLTRARIDDFSRDEPRSIVGPQGVGLPEPAMLRKVALSASGQLGNASGIDESEVSINAWKVERLFVSTANVRSLEAGAWVQVRVEAAVQASDGMRVDDVEEFFVAAGEPERLEFETRAAAARVAAMLAQVSQAPLVEDYSGPVLFEGEAAPQIIYDVLSPMVVGSPPADLEQPAWVRKLGKRVLPLFLSVTDDPRSPSLLGQTVVGHYLFDEQGVAPQRVSLIEQGRLKELLMARSPNQRADKSTGHGRAGLSGWPRAHIGSLVVDNRAKLAPGALRQRLLKTAAEQGLSYALVVKALEPRGFVSGGASPPRPLRVFRVNPDGSEFPVRGAMLAELTARDLRDIVAAGELSTVYNVRQETGGLPLMSTVTSPSLLFEELEVRLPPGGHGLPHRIEPPR